MNMCDAYMSQLKSIKTSFQTSKNLLAPIHNLPLELFLQVIEFAADEPFKPYYASLFLLRSVSTYWRSRIDNCPTLWKHVPDYPQSVPLLKVILQKSHPILMDMSYRDAKYRALPPWKVTSKETEYLTELTRHTSRWRSLTASFRDSRHFSQLIQSPSSTLRSLSIDCAEPLSVPEELFTSIFPGLEDIALDNCILPRSPSLFRHAKTLHLRNLKRQTLSFILENVTAASAQLESLVIHAEDISFDVQGPLESKVSLPCIRELHLHSFTAFALLCTLNSFEIPLSAGVRFSTYATTHKSLSKLSDFIVTRIRGQSSTSPVGIGFSFHPWGTMSFSWGDSMDFYFKAGLSLEQQILWLENMFSRLDGSNVHSLELLANENREIKEAFQALGEYLPNVKRINLESSSVRAERLPWSESVIIAEMLAQPYQGRGGARRWLFPKCNKMGWRFKPKSSTVAVEMILDLVRRRWGEQAKPDDGGVIPLRLDTLCLPYDLEKAGSLLTKSFQDVRFDWSL